MLMRPGGAALHDFEHGVMPIAFRYARGTMPSVAKKLSEAELAQVMRYLKGLRK